MILSTVDCRYCGERLEVAVGPDDADGEIGSDLACRSCGYYEPVRPRWRRSDIQAAIRERNRQCGHFDEGTVVPLHIDTSPFPEEDWASEVISGQRPLALPQTVEEVAP